MILQNIAKLYCIASQAQVSSTQTHDTVLHHKLCSRCNALLTWRCFLHCLYQGSHARDRTFAAQGTEASRIAANTTPNKSTLNQLKIENDEAPYTNTGGKAFGLWESLQMQIMGFRVFLIILPIFEENLLL